MKSQAELKDLQFEKKEDNSTISINSMEKCRDSFAFFCS